MTAAASPERQELMLKLLRRMAIEVDPKHARLNKLADALCVDLATVLRWVKVGRTNSNRAKALNQRFGNELANVEVLTDTAL